MGARVKAWVCGPSIAGIAGSNPAVGMDVCVLWVLSGIYLSREDNLSRGVVQSVVCLSVIVKPRQRSDPGPLGAVQPGKRSVLKSTNLLIVLFSSSSCRFLLLGADIHLITLFSHTLNPCVLHLRETTLPQKRTRKIMLLCKLILIFSDRERQDLRFWTE